MVPVLAPQVECDDEAEFEEAPRSTMVDHGGIPQIGHLNRRVMINQWTNPFGQGLPTSF